MDEASTPAPDEVPFLSVDQVLEQGAPLCLGGIRFGRFQWGVTSVMGLIWICGALQTMNMVFYLSARPSSPTSSEFPQTIEEEWDMKPGSSGFVGSCFFFGWLLGNWGFGALSDTRGRKFTLYVTTFVSASAGLLSAAAPNLFVFTVLRAICGAGSGGMGLSSWVLVAEYWPPSARVVGGCLFHGWFSIGIFIVALIAYLLSDPSMGGWRALIVATSLPSLLPLLALKLSPESARWLHTQGRKNHATEALRRATQTNRCPLAFHLRGGSGPGDTGGEMDVVQYGIVDLFSMAKLRLITLILMFAWFTVSFSYYGISLHAGNVRNVGADDGEEPLSEIELESPGGPFANKALNTLLAGVVEIPAFILSIPLLAYGGRRLGCLLFLGALALACLGFGMMPQASVFFIMVGKLASAGAFAAIYLFSTELFPTVLRNLGIGLCSLSARIGGIAAPLVVAMGHDWLALPMICFGLSSLGAAFLIMWLPETLGRPLADTLEDVATKSDEYGELEEEGIELDEAHLQEQEECVFDSNRQEEEEDL